MARGRSGLGQVGAGVGAEHAAQFLAAHRIDLLGLGRVGLGALQRARKLLAGLGLLGIGALGGGRCGCWCCCGGYGCWGGNVAAGVFAEGFNQLQHSLLIHQLGLLGIAGCGLEFAGEFLAGLAFLGAAQQRAGLGVGWRQGGRGRRPGAAGAGWCGERSSRGGSDPQVMGGGEDGWRRAIHAWSLSPV